MEADEIAVVLSKASELRSKLNNCILERAAEEYEDGVSQKIISDVNQEQRTWMEGGDTEAESLVKVRDALESLEEQLAILQDLQERQRLERDTTLAELDESRRILIKELKEYRGMELEVIRETLSFAGESVGQRDNIVLPPYGQHLPRSLFSSFDNYSPLLHSVHSVRRSLSARQSSVTGYKRQDSEHGNDCNEKEENSRPGINNGNPKRLRSGIWHIIGFTTKAVLVVASVISVFTLVHFEPKLRRSASLKIPGLLLKQRGSSTMQTKADVPKCPPGKVLLIEDGVPRCFVKERVEVPFEPFIKVPDVSYGCG